MPWRWIVVGMLLGYAFYVVAALLIACVVGASLRRSSRRFTKADEKLVHDIHAAIQRRPYDVEADE